MLPLVCLGFGCGAAPLDDRARIVDALDRADALDRDRALAHVSHTCDLLIEGVRYPVVDVHELVKGAQVARGVNFVLVLSPALHPLQRVAYATERPLFCRGNRLFFHGSVTVGDSEGDVLVFGAGARVVGVENVDANDWPIYPAP